GIRLGPHERPGGRSKPRLVSGGAGNPVTVRAARRVFQALSLPARVRAVRVRTEVPDQPFGEEALQGAVNRAKAALGGGDFGVGIEAGLVWYLLISDYFDVQYCGVVDQSGRLTAGHGPGVSSTHRAAE